MYRHIDSDQVIVRAAHPGDATDLRRLAALDSGTAPVGAALVAESDARILAALPLGSGRPIADPFEPTAELVALLELRREQLRRGERKERRSRGRLRGLLRVPALTGRRA
jgi:hypothetical protein